MAPGPPRREILLSFINLGDNTQSHITKILIVQDGLGQARRTLFAHPMINRTGDLVPMSFKSHIQGLDLKQVNNYHRALKSALSYSFVDLLLTFRTPSIVITAFELSKTWIARIAT